MNYIKLIVTRTDGSRSTCTLKGVHVTPLMLQVVDELIYTMTTNKLLRRVGRKSKKRRVGRKSKKLTTRTKQTESRGNADGTGIHSMVEGNRDDFHT